MACYLVHHYQPGLVQICVQDPEMAMAAVQRLAWLENGLFVEHEELREKIRQTLGIKLRLLDRKVEPDVALILFSRRAYTEPPQARHLVLLERNALSYKTLLYPGQIQDNVLAHTRWFQQRYKLHQRIGLFGPSFLCYWSLALLSGSRFAPTHFRQGQKALDRLYTISPMWWTGYMVVLSGDRCK
ncbi:MAG TPA: hypothetical protein VFM05_01065 [Candidatus Saccharimonadales bacterium]|nr:hypothetical protein [Candidatus Saccharimonadales bacterium]